MAESSPLMTAPFSTQTYIVASSTSKRVENQCKKHEKQLVCDFAHVDLGLQQNSTDICTFW